MYTDGSGAGIEGKSAKRPGRSEGIKTFEIGSIKKEESSGCKIGKKKEEIAESYERVAKEVYLSFVLFIKMCSIETK